MIAGILGVLGNMFGTAKAGQSIIDHISNGLDKLDYTSQEKAEDAMKMKQAGWAVYQKWLEATTGSRIARRVIALIVVGIWAMEHVAATVMNAIAPFFENAAMVAALHNSATSLAAQASGDASLVMVVLGFYFGGPVVADSVGNALKTWKAKQTAPTQPPAAQG